jgi:hypothetical protein
LENPAIFWQLTWRRTLILIALCALPLLLLAGIGMALGVLLGGLLLLADIYLLKAPLGMMLDRVRSRKRPWILALGLLRIVVLGVLLFLLIKFQVANVMGLLVGVTLPIVAIVTLLVTGGLTAWKV